MTLAVIGIGLDGSGYDIDALFLVEDGHSRRPIGRTTGIGYAGLRQVRPEPR
ncbi:hypothetical protein [Streptosporangium sp. NPDC049046]|uniref:hypothetical protein n=1 Tax=Streptosporangium sp. NPDC049046 TaxID=3155031 RepID=UPI00343709ED